VSSAKEMKGHGQLSYGSGKGASGGFLQTPKQFSGYHKRWGISFLTEEILASAERSFSCEFDRQYVGSLEVQHTVKCSYMQHLATHETTGGSAPKYSEI